MIEKLEVLIGLAQLVGHCPANQKVTGSIPSQGTCLDWGFSPMSGQMQEATSHCFYFTSMLLLLSSSLPSPLSKSK